MGDTPSKGPDPRIGTLVKMLDFFDPELEGYVVSDNDEVLGVITQVKLMDEHSEKPWLKLGVRK